MNIDLSRDPGGCSRDLDLSTGSHSSLSDLGSNLGRRSCQVSLSLRSRVPGRPRSGDILLAVDLGECDLCDEELAQLADPDLDSDLSNPPLDEEDGVLTEIGSVEVDGLGDCEDEGTRDIGMFFNMAMLVVSILRSVRTLSLSLEEQLLSM